MSRWFEEEAVIDRFKQMALSKLKKQPRVKCIIGNNLATYISEEVVKLHRKYDIRLFQVIKVQLEGNSQLLQTFQSRTVGFEKPAVQYESLLFYDCKCKRCSCNL